MEYAVPQDEPGKRKSVALTISVVFHALLVLFFLWWKIITPIPPFPELGGGGGGLDIDLGYSAEGMGVDNSSMPTPQNNPAPPVKGTEELLTDEDPEAPEINAPSKPDKPKPDKPKPDKPKPEKPKPTEAELQQAAIDRMNALYNNPGTGQGNGNKPGNQGSQDGSANGGGTGTGGGSGTGSGTGTGTGAGPGSDGIGYSLGGRSMRFKPPINDKPGVAGTVVLDIYVDKDGNVLSAEQNLSQSTTMAHNLVQIAKTTALQCKFEKRTSGPDEQKGTITFKFKVS